MSEIFVATAMHLVLLALGVALATLAIFVVLRKYRRDRLSAGSVRWREGLRRTLSTVRRPGLPEESTDFAGLASALPDTGIRTDRLADLDQVLGIVDATDRDLIRAASEATGLSARIRELTRGRDPVRRGLAVSLLAHLRDRQAVAAARRALADGDPDVRLVAARSLSFVVDDPSTAALIEGIRLGLLPDSRLVERLVNQERVPALLAALEGAVPGIDPTEYETETRVRVGVIRALGLIADTRAETPLLSLAFSTSPEVRINVARALGTCGTSRSVPALIRSLGDDDGHVRAQAAKSLGRLRAVEAVPALELALTDPGWWVRANTGTALSLLGSAGYEALERAALGEDPFAALRAREQLMIMSRVGS